jgi:GAF domain-containing protein
MMNANQRVALEEVGPECLVSGAMDERRGARCPRCASTRMEMSVRGSSIVYLCGACAHEWAERRVSGLARDDDAARGEAAHRAVEAICAARDLGSLMTATRTWARQLTGADGVSFVLRSGNSCYYADEEAIAPLWKGQRFPLESCVSGWVMQHRESVLIPDIYADPRVMHEVYRPTFVRSMLMAPVRKADPIAAIGAYWQTLCAPTLSHVQLIELLAEAAAVRLTSDQVWARAVLQTL